jgi:ATP-dependent helicase/nuclease subunit B
MLPNKISATNIELLIRNPYGFYAKYMLRLRRLENLYDQKSLAKFGNFIHQIIEDYTNQYSESTKDRQKFILDIGQKLARNDYANNDQVNLYWPKFEALSQAFIEFDEERRKRGAKVMPEKYGEMRIKLKNKEITITAIADRIDIFPDGSLHILDYKTGAVPTKSDIFSGISVQLIIEALIAQNGGFADIKGDITELTYVKFIPSSPYIKTSSINISEIDLEEHKRGLVKLLSHYDSGEEYLVNHSPNYSPTYDDYKHLTRKG